MSRIVAIAAALALSLPACSKKGSQPAEAGAQGGAAPLVLSAAFVSASATLRREPSDAQRVPGPTGKEIPNVLAVLQRGEKVALLETREDWVKARSSDDREGWVKRTSILEGEGLAVATVLVQTDVFDRPDLLAANAKRKIDPGTLLLVVKTKPPFSEVNAGGSSSSWVLSERLAAGDREVSVAKLMAKARWLERSGKHDDAMQILAVARANFAGVPLVDVLATELGEAPPADGIAQPPTGEQPAAH